MAVMKLQNNMVFWDIIIDKVPNWNSLMNNIVANMSVTYEVNKPTKAVIQIISDEFIENIFTVGRAVEIKMGFDPLDLVPMFSGVIMTDPMGDAQDQLSYTIELESNEVFLATTTKNKVYSPPVKKKIIEQIAGEWGYGTDIQIKDTAKLKKGNIPIQTNQTDLEFLNVCASRWRCVFWFSKDTVGQTILHFHDLSSAYVEGNAGKINNVEDKLSEYILGYRTDSVDNNVSHVNWKFNPKQGNGEPGIRSFFESGSKELPENWVISYRGVRYQLNKTIVKATKINKRLGKYWFQMIAISYNNGVGNVGATVKQFFERCKTDSKTQMDSAGSEAITLTVELNIGDPWLRIPRTAKLLYGSEDPRAVSSSLPAYIYEGETPETSFFRMKKVVTSLNAGKLNTEITLSRSIDGTN